MVDKRATHATFVIVDIERFGRRADDDQRWLRGRMYDVLRDAVEQAGIDWSTCESQDRGDSIILLVPATVPKIAVTEALVERLDRNLARYARRSAEPVRMRLRLALHAGEVARDEHGWIGTDLNTACRLADLQQARDLLSATPDANLVVVVSDHWYRSVVRQDPVLVDQFAFTRVPFVAKEVDDHAWLHIRGATTNGGATADATPGGPAARSSIGFQFNGPVRMHDAIQGDQVNHRTDAGAT